MFELFKTTEGFKSSILKMNITLCCLEAITVPLLQLEFMKTKSPCYWAFNKNKKTNRIQLRCKCASITGWAGKVETPQTKYGLLWFEQGHKNSFAYSEWTKQQMLTMVPYRQTSPFSVIEYIWQGSVDSESTLKWSIFICLLIYFVSGLSQRLNTCTMNSLFSYLIFVVIYLFLNR